MFNYTNGLILYCELPALAVALWEELGQSLRRSHKAATSGAVVP